MAKACRLRLHRRRLRLCRLAWRRRRHRPTSRFLGRHPWMLMEQAARRILHRIAMRLPWGHLQRCCRLTRPRKSTPWHSECNRVIPAGTKSTALHCTSWHLRRITTTAVLCRIQKAHRARRRLRGMHQTNTARPEHHHFAASTNRTDEVKQAHPPGPFSSSPPLHGKGCGWSISDRLACGHGQQQVGPMTCTVLHAVESFGTRPGAG